MRYLFAFIIFLCSTQVWAASNDVLLNLQDPTATSPFTSTLKVMGVADGGTNPTVKLPTLPCVANAAAPTWVEGSLVPCSVGLDGTMRTTAASGGSTYLDADGIANQTASAVHGQTYMYNGVTWDRVRGAIASGLEVNCVTGCAGGSSTPTDAFANPATAGLQQTFNMMYNGATWDMVRGTVAGGVLVNVSNASLAVTGTFFQATQPISAVALPLPTGAATEATLATRLADATFTGRFAAAYVDVDAIANQTTTAVHGQSYFYNGATWDRMRGTIAGGLLVDVSDAFVLDATVTNRLPAGSTPADNESNAITASRLPVYSYIFDGATWDRWTGAVSQSGTWNIGTVTAVTSITNPVAVTGTFFQATQPVSIAATVTVQGAKTNNSAAPGATNIGTLPCVAQAAAPSHTEGNQVGCSTTLGGGERVVSETAANFNTRPDTSGATGAAPPARADFIGGLTSGATGGFVVGMTVCDTPVTINVSAATTTLLVTGVAGRHVRICTMNVSTTLANGVALISGTGATCGTGTTGMNGGTTGVTGWQFVASGGLTQGGGVGEINRTNATGDSVCIVTSVATQLSGRMMVAIY